MDFNIAAAHEAISAAIPDRDCIVYRDRRLSFATVTDRSRRLANALIGLGLGTHRERAELAGHEIGQDTVGLYLRNGNEYLESMLGCFKARAASFNVNYRYVTDELRALFADSGAAAIVYHAEFAPLVAEVIGSLTRPPHLVQVADDSGHDLLPGADDYETLLASASPERPDLAWSPDDLYVAYTGGTTGHPKGVLWRQADIFAGAMGGSDAATGVERASMEEILAAATGPRVHPHVLTTPLMHVAGQWISFIGWFGGNPVVIPPDVTRFDARSVLDIIDAERAVLVNLVGNAMGRPLLAEMAKGAHDLSSLRVISTGGAAMTADVKTAFVEALPKAIIVDTMGASESGAAARKVSSRDTGVTAGDFEPSPGSCVLSEDFGHVLEPGSDETGWMARRGRVPLGYLNDPDKTAATFPVIDGVRYSVPGDRARIDADGVIQLLGRDSVCINTGGEKVYVEEVEAALHSHPAITDVVVVGRPSEQWGSEVVAIVATSADPTDDELVDHAAGHLARYKLPKAIIRVDELVRNPNGKADYRWAAEVAAAAG